MRLGLMVDLKRRVQSQTSGGSDFWGFRRLGVQLESLGEASCKTVGDSRDPTMGLSYNWTVLKVAELPSVLSFRTDSLPR
jgi:hypothetical protein